MKFRLILSVLVVIVLLGLFVVTQQNETSSESAPSIVVPEGNVNKNFNL